ncbi:tissue factor isoform X2 [Hyperolius riggenbachi]|uniref:tissue factor isoform X2 n=1 Tax=Hyperolius riggenbachi TaxID=752182 RepID=UPI0035A2EAC8
MAGLYLAMRCIPALFLCAIFCWQRTLSLDVNFPVATDIKVSSTNFKTILEWKGKPTNFTYTVEVRGPGLDWTRKCIYITATECDVSELVKDNGNYEFRVLSEIQTEDIVTEEFPYADGPTFNPFEQSIIGTPGIENLTFNEDHTQLKVIIKDPVTPYRFANKTLKTVRDLLGNKFKYTVFYTRVGSTGRKEVSTPTNEVVIKTSQGEGYCLYVQAAVLSRKTDIFSHNSHQVCTSSGGSAASGFAASTVFLYLCNMILLYWLL